MHNSISINTHDNDPEVLLALQAIAEVRENQGLSGDYYLSCTMKLNGLDVIIFSTHYEVPKLQAA